MNKQVDKSHYGFGTYLNKIRWISIWHQLDEVLSLEPKTVLELGPGTGVFKKMAELYIKQVETVDIDPDLHPDHVASAIAMPFQDGSYDVVCAFQMLEHLPYDESLKAVKEMIRVGKRHIVISLPNARIMWRYLFHIPYLGDIRFLIPKPRLMPKEHVFDGEHYWEINKKGYPLARIVNDITGLGAKLVKSYLVYENSYHRIFVFEIDEI